MTEDEIVKIKELAPEAYKVYGAPIKDNKPKQHVKDASCARCGVRGLKEFIAKNHVSIGYKCECGMINMRRYVENK